MNRALTLLFLACNFYSHAQQMNPARAGKPAPPTLQTGVYLTWDEARVNRPSLSLSDLFKSYYDDQFTIFDWAHTEKLYFLNDSGKKTSLSRDSVWGFSEDGTVFICMNRRFHKVLLFGSICVFRETYPTISDPIPLVVTDKKSEARKRLYDFKTGRVSDFDHDHVVSLLVRDPELFSEFNALKSLREKKKKLYRFIERYNERNPPFAIQ